MDRIARSNLKKEFNFDNTKFTQIEKEETTGRYLYKRERKDGSIMGYEVIQPRKHTNPDGSIVYTYPSSSDFGSCAWFLPPNVERVKIDYYLKGLNKEITYKEFLKK